MGLRQDTWVQDDKVTMSGEDVKQSTAKSKQQGKWRVASGGWREKNRHVFVLALLLWLIPCFVPARAQNLDKPVMAVDDEVTAFAYAPDGRIVFSVRRMFKSKKYDMQRDDIFIAEANGKRRRILEGQKFTHGDKPFTYQVESFTWSPNGHFIAVQLFTTTVDPEDEHHDDARALLLLDDSGH